MHVRSKNKFFPIIYILDEVNEMMAPSSAVLFSYIVNTVADANPEIFRQSCVLSKKEKNYPNSFHYVRFEQCFNKTEQN